KFRLRALEKVARWSVSILTTPSVARLRWRRDYRLRQSMCTSPLLKRKWQDTSPNEDGTFIRRLESADIELTSVSRTPTNLAGSSQVLSVMARPIIVLRQRAPPT